MLELLLVDDEMSVVETLAVTIPWAEIGIGTIHKAYSASEALDIVNIHPIDIAITDIGMPGMDGLELTRSIYKHWKHIKCILLTAHADFKYAQTAIKNNICDYLLKPVSDKELIERVSSVVQTIRTERESNNAYQRAMKAMRDHLPRLRGELLYDLLQGKRVSTEKLVEKIHLLEVPVQVNDSIVMIMIRFKDQFSDLDPFEMSLMEFAIVNMAQETLEEYFNVWFCKDVHEYLVLAVTPKSSDDPQSHVNRLTQQLQRNIEHFLKKKVSILLGQWGVFPEDITKLYNHMLQIFSMRLGQEKDLPVYIMDDSEVPEVRTLLSLYEPPALLHLMEAGHWEVASLKISSIIEELEADWSDSSEHMLEAFFAFFAAFSYLAHKNGKKLADLIDDDYVRGKELIPAKTVKHLTDWTLRVFEKFKQQAVNEHRSARMVAVKEAQKFILSHLSGDISLQTISEHLQMHPAYLSRIYKLETGENLSDYITRLKMEYSQRLLKHSSKKIYEVAIEAGYQNPHYFIKLFKKHYGLTPQEYRNSTV
ncbi:two-component system response regulator YesN [Paenibacillus sp. V4I3]|uniref:response regulator transcription factor n=1 Tax=unclassified Paenibacillus TaxID=185978 RepID=UPI00278533FC|nr:MULTISPECIES: response regulator [unclassified Paenibacillus]MDQ0874468.1 two-component system response regulator YesN [Paenibacillus sp. V4I3]MDQ0889774.1 two-component system response regulator YesN [Paenibacillus sp. V4I9]